MMLRTEESIRRFLQQHHEFGECVLLDIRWHHFGTVLDLVFDYAWDDIRAGERQSRIRADVNTPLLKTIRCHLVEELHLKNGLTPAMMESPRSIAWGFSEVAAVRLENDERFLSPYRSALVPFHHLACLWEEERRIDLVFSWMEVGL